MRIRSADIETGAGRSTANSPRAQTILTLSQRRCATLIFELLDTGRCRIGFVPRGAPHAGHQHPGSEVGAQDRSDLVAEERIEAEDLAPVIDKVRRIARRLSVLDDPLRRAARVDLVHEGEHPLLGAAPRPDLLARRNLGPEGEDRLDLKGTPPHRLCRPDPAALAQVLERVEAEPHIDGLAGGADSGSDL